ncbi:hypothetical protein PG996_009585 [Apiospora saccharicola]|uniref:Uncharacterized protein n=1 Tax=Apiospora saccharicola TaxID=335842 RepID=A0ABR1UL67_9PEZI
MDSNNFPGIFYDMNWKMDPHMNDMDFRKKKESTLRQGPATSHHSLDASSQLPQYFSPGLDEQGNLQNSEFYKHSSPTSSIESAKSGQHVFTPCSFDENIGPDLEYRGFGSPGAPDLLRNYENGRGWMVDSPSNVQATLPCPNCRTHIKLQIVPDTAPFTGGNTFKNTAPDPQQFQRWPNSPSDPIATIAPSTTMSMHPVSIHPAAMVGGGGYAQQGSFLRQQHQPTALQSDLCLQPAAAQSAPSMNTIGTATGTGTALTYSSISRRTSSANLNSPVSCCESPSDHSSPNEGNNNKRKRLDNKERPARYVPFLGILIAAPEHLLSPTQSQCLR